MSGLHSLVGDTGFEPVTSSVSRKRATTAPTAHVQLSGEQPRWVPDLNRCRRICSPLPRLSANPPRGSLHVRARAGARDPLRADDGIRTRDPHLGKVMLYQLSHVRVLAERPWPFGAWNTIYGSFGALQNGRAPRWGRPAISHTGGASAIVFLRGRLAQLVARFVHTEEVISSSLVSPTTALGVLRRGRFASRDTPSPPRRGRLMRKLPHRCP